MRASPYFLIAACIAVTVSSSGAFSQTAKQRLPIPNECLKDLDVVRNQIERDTKKVPAKQNEQLTLKYADRIARDALTSERTKEPLQKLIACLHGIER